MIHVVITQSFVLSVRYNGVLLNYTTFKPQQGSSATRSDVIPCARGFGPQSA